MRVGQNPAKFVQSVNRPERVTVAVLSYIPFLSGFYAETLDVLRACLLSIRNKAGLPFDLMVFDNGSCQEVCDFLIEEKDRGRIQYLILSEKNVGKGGAWNVIFAAAPGQIVSYSDSDVLFSPGWLSRSIEVLETFPEVGMVTARPFRTPPGFFQSTISWGRGHALLEEGQFIPWQTFLEFNLSLGQSEEENKRIYADTRDVRLEYEGVAAFAGASHWQFTGYKSRLQQFLPFDMERPMGQVRELDRRMDEAGLLRLMITDPLAMNMSNTTGYLRGELAARLKAQSAPRRRRLRNWGPLKKIMLAIYNKIFRWYYS